jgi:hypothetical protein
MTFWTRWIFPLSDSRPHRSPPGPSLGTPPWLLTSPIFRATGCIAPAFLSAVLLVLPIGMHNNLGRLRTSLERCGASGPSWASTAPLGTVTATVVSYSASTSTSMPVGADTEWAADSTPLALLRAQRAPCQCPHYICAVRGSINMLEESSK